MRALCQGARKRVVLTFASRERFELLSKFTPSKHYFSPKIRRWRAQSSLFRNNNFILSTSVPPLHAAARRTEEAKIKSSSSRGDNRVPQLFLLHSAGYKLCSTSRSGSLEYQSRNTLNPLHHRRVEFCLNEKMMKNVHILYPLRTEKKKKLYVRDGLKRGGAQKKEGVKNILREKLRQKKLRAR